MKPTIRGNMYFVRSFFLLVVGGLLAMACTHVSENSAPDEKGTLSGHVQLLDSVSYPTRSDSVTITIPALAATCLTDPSGQWRINNIPIGTYEVDATRPGYGTMKWFDIHVTGPGTYFLSPVTIGPTPRYHLYIDSVRVGGPASQKTLDIFGRIDNYHESCYIYPVLDVDSNLFPNMPHYTQYGLGSEVQSEGTWKYSVSVSQLWTLSSGAKVFLSVFGNTGYQPTDFYDPSSGQMLPISPSQKSNSLPFIVP
ncbi:MAG: carboxypeptidase-like regulatory domain-containing protein [Bacteroidota bacterium]|nr:carboxypeptidase-like regulatory domain-containing protein [Bacteroidota bacterium]MDP4232084.1 carboxypeptidase-like regulatory domain-containing protein [Bacteroidota bacterium]MDP4241209.1 carboxypeptidase-like regulatory domain-containing protein [Bacteroidota bacterium]MDP4286601.1 carboxypeptidase-like regulatory domain-containing protein [Bacteroidota bacterium]